jgi:hypothetical protein
MRASEAYALLEANISGGCIQAPKADDPLCASLVRKGWAYVAATADWSALEKWLLGDLVPRTFFITPKGRRALRRAIGPVLGGRVGYKRGDCFALWAEGN